MESMGLPNIFEDVLDEGISIGEARGISIGEARGISIGEARGISIGEARGRSEVCASMRSQLIAGGMPPQEADRYIQLALADLNLSNQ